MRLILASNSPRRRELLRHAGFEFEVHPSAIDEIRLPGEPPEEFARRAAREKALQVAATLSPECVVLGADTIVVVGDKILGKPRDAADAARTLRKLSGTTHRVITGVCLVRAPDHIEALEHVTTSVTFRRLGDDEIQTYLQTGEPYDKAGAYGIQGAASRFVERLEGSTTNVVGLPLSRVREMLEPFIRPGSRP